MSFTQGLHTMPSFRLSAWSSKTLRSVNTTITWGGRRNSPMRRQSRCLQYSKREDTKY